MEKLDIKILSLYKHHYLDYYDGSLKTDYSSLGYYDGFSIIDVGTRRTKMFEKVSNAPISPIWYGIGDSVNELVGSYSKQNIGIFRPNQANDSTDDFWNGKYKNSPYFAIGFLQLDNIGDYQEVATFIEEEKEPLVEDADGKVNEPFVQNMVYYTFDNAHLIVLTKSNSLKKLGEIVKKLETDNKYKVRYLHSIIGISNQYLKSCGTEVSSSFGKINCHIDEKLSCINLRIVTTGKKGTLEKIKFLLSKLSKPKKNEKQGQSGGKVATYSYVAGHESIIIRIPGTDIGSLLAMLLEEGVSTHGNLLFGHDISNIETDVIFKEESLNLENLQMEELERTSEEEKPESWCGMLIDHYKSQMYQIYNRGDESLYSYYRAFIQTLNTLAQYEGFALSKDIFYLLFPSIKMFHDHLMKVSRDENESNFDSKKIKDGLAEFLTAINAVIYHTIHTDQVFLMVPGYSGTSYSIPIKNCLLYLGVAEYVIKLLNDKEYKYNCLLTPEMESRPKTSLINIGASNEDRLIHFSASQRSLYIPRHFLIILTHEIAHYVGTEQRAREKRADNLINSVSYFMAEALLPESSPGDVKKEIYNIYLQATKIKIKNACDDYLKKEIENTNENRKYHSIELEKILQKACDNFLANGQNGLGKILNEVPEEIMKKSMDENLMELSEEIGKIQRKMQYHRTVLITNSTMKIIIAELMRMYREIFSDVAAICILKCNKKTFDETFSVSEGIIMQDDNDINIIDVVRKKLAEDIFFSQNCNQNDKQCLKKQQGTSVQQTESVVGEEGGNNTVDIRWPQNLKDEIFSYIWVASDLMEYAKKCKEGIEKWITEDAEQKKLLNNIRNIYNLFADDSKDCCTIYSEIVEQIHKYTMEVNKAYQETIETMINSKKADQ